VQPFKTLTPRPQCRHTKASTSENPLIWFTLPQRGAGGLSRFHLHHDALYLLDGHHCRAFIADEIGLVLDDFAKAPAAFGLDFGMWDQRQRHSSKNVQAQHPPHKEERYHGYDDITYPLARSFRFGPICHGWSLAVWGPSSDVTAAKFPFGGTQRRVRKRV